MLKYLLFNHIVCMEKRKKMNSSLKQNCRPRCDLSHRLSTPFPLLKTLDQDHELAASELNASAGRNLKFGILSFANDLICTLLPHLSAPKSTRVFWRVPAPAPRGAAVRRPSRCREHGARRTGQSIPRPQAPASARRRTGKLCDFHPLLPFSGEVSYHNNNTILLHFNP